MHPLPAGAPLPAFATGGAGERELQRSMESFHLAGIVVVQDDKLRLERHAPGYGPEGRWVSFSVAKSVTSTLVGTTIKDGYISREDDPVTRYIPELRGSAYDEVTLRQLLTMTSGVKWNEDYVDPKADVTQFHIAPVGPGMDATVSYMRSGTGVTLRGPSSTTAPRRHPWGRTTAGHRCRRRRSPR